ncbi:peptide ABC transporter ATP-binding protein [Saccharobesus litoralis]|uniref:Peptide ABC transporter ATP-binding protein n=1 Tax=Saccharobesus litoralis TaxID=2172099 RepID=A0A2S0VSA6_9ALTE|nr:oligopeptide/dipeptide ABC transporter ATP-binding protein [Saccharobesus litoralis]AWB67094.1 peptide ABC transporter ATP-binding protein [Saccharobesus litoralis]
MALLDVRNLTVTLNDDLDSIHAIDKMSLTIRENGFHGLVGESGSGKTLFAKALMGILDERWTVKADRLFWQDRDLLKMSAEKRREVINRDIAMIFQEPSRSLDPTAPIFDQLSEVIPTSELKCSFWARKQARRQYAANLLKKVGIKSYDFCLDAFPHELSEGQCQKIMIAMAIARKPKMLIADEPTDAMESTTKVQILRLLQKLNETQDMAILLISHDLEAVTHWAKNMTILYAGQSVEAGNVKELVANPFHPYTKALFQNLAQFTQQANHKSPLTTLKGTTPPLQHLPIGCRLGPRCPQAQKNCVIAPKANRVKGHVFNCHFPINVR